MNEVDKKHYLERYNKRFSQSGISPETLGWGGGKERQNLRFKVALEVIHLIEIRKGCVINSILDVGCGFGDFGVFLKDNAKDIKYTGVDINPLLVAKGKELQPDLDLQHVDILSDSFEGKFDIVVENGIFNFKLSAENQEKYIYTMLDRMYGLANYAVCADFMSTFVDYKHPDAYHLNEYKALEMGKSISDKVILRNDYLPYEYMIYVLR